MRISTIVFENELSEGYRDTEGAIYSKDIRRLLRGPVSCSQYRIKSGTKTICNEAFKYCSCLVSVDIPDTVVNIGDEAFAGCRQLTSIEIPKSVIDIGSNPFYDTDISTINNHSDHFIVDDNALYDQDRSILISVLGTQIISTSQIQLDA